MRRMVVGFAVVALLGLGLAACGRSEANGKLHPHPIDAAVPDVGGSAGQGLPQACGPGGQGGAGGASGAGGGGGGPATCQSDPLHACLGVASGRWCVEALPGGTAFEPQSVWSDRPNDVWVVGWHRLANGDREAAILRGNGCTWTPIANPDPSRFQFSNGVWGAAANDVWIVGVGDGALHFDGEALTFVPMPVAAPQTAVDIRSASGTGPHDVWTGGHQVLHWDGESWTAALIETNNPNQYFADVWAVAPNDVWAAGDQVVAHFDGVSWTVTELVTGPIGLSSFLYAIWASGGEAWAAGPGGRLHHYQGGQWTLVGAPSDTGPILYDLGGLDGDLHLVGTQSTLSVLDGAAGFVPVADAPPTAVFNQGVWVSPSQVWVVTSDQNLAPLLIRRPR